MMEIGLLGFFGQEGLIFIISSYFVGSVPSGLIVAKIWNVQDPREIGSGNIGATNMLRTGNKQVALVTLIADMLKGALPTLVGVYMYRLGYVGETLPYVALLASVSGHCFPVWLKFQGGKGVATYMGGLAALPVGGFLIIGAVIWIVVAFVSRYSSLASLCSIAGVCAYTYYVAGIPQGIPVTLLTILIVFQHRTNIIRLWKREESRIKL